MDELKVTDERTLEQRRIPRHAQRQWVGALLIAVLANLALIIKLIHLRAVPGSRHDFAWIYMAGRTWLSGHSPYDLDSLAQARLSQDWGGVPPLYWAKADLLFPFVYPCHWAAIAIPAALLPWRLAAALWDGVNYASFLALFAVCWHLALKRRPSLSKPLLLASLGLCALSGGTRWTFGDSQMDLLPLLGVAGAFWAHERGSRNWLAFFTFVAALKPQLSVYPLLFLFLRNGGVAVASGSLAALAVSFLAQLPSGLGAFPAQAIHSARAHAMLDFNAPATFDDAAALLALVLPDRWAMFASVSFGLACTVAFARGHKFYLGDPAGDPLWQLALSCALSVAFFPQHGYGFVAYVPVIVVALQFRPRWLALGVVLLAMAAGRIRNAGAQEFPLLAAFACVAVLAGCILALSHATGQSRRDRAAAGEKKALVATSSSASL